MFTAINSTWDTLNTTWTATPTYVDSFDATRRTPQSADMLDPSWVGATLKYFYLVFSDPRLASLDDFVFNPEGHLLRRL